MPPSASASSLPPPRQHGVKGVYYGGDWLDLEDCAGRFFPNDTELANHNNNNDKCHGCDRPCPRSRSRTSPAPRNSKEKEEEDSYAVLIIGAGCIGAAIARELSKFVTTTTTTNHRHRHNNNVLWVEAADDVSQGATKGNSGIVHAGYDDTPGSVRAQYCWPGNQLFAQLDRELRFGYQKNGSLVVAVRPDQVKELHHLYQRGQANGVQRLRIITNRDNELWQLEPHLTKDAIAALYAPDAGNVIPYEYTIALAENAVDNGIDLRIRRRVTKIERLADDEEDGGGGGFRVTMEHWEPTDYVQAVTRHAAARSGSSSLRWSLVAGSVASVMVVVHYLVTAAAGDGGDMRYHLTALVALWVAIHQMGRSNPNNNKDCTDGSVWKDDPPLQRLTTPLMELVQQAGRAIGTGHQAAVQVADMLVGGSGSPTVQQGTVVAIETVRCQYIVNCAGGAADQIAHMIGDDSFHIKPRLGDYLLLNRNQGHLAKHTIFPCPDPVLGKGVLVQTTLWGNLILGPTARDMHKDEARDMSPAAVQEYILSQCKKLVPSFDAKETIHAFCGARAKSDRGDWIIGPSPKNKNMIHVAGIDSPGLAGSPAIAVDVVKMLQQAGLQTKPNPHFNPNRAPIITPKSGMKGLKMGPVGKYDSDGKDEAQMAQNVICKCEKVTELEVVRAMRRSLPIDSSQGIRKRTRAGMGHCQGDPDNYNCEARVRAIIARENGVPVDHVGGRPWPATSTLSERWIGEEEKKQLEERMMKD